MREHELLGNSGVTAVLNGGWSCYQCAKNGSLRVDNWEQNKAVRGGAHSWG